MFMTLLQFMNKVLYAREGAKTLMDRSFADYPWQVRVEVDGVEVEVPEVRISHSYLSNMHIFVLDRLWSVTF